MKWRRRRGRRQWGRGGVGRGRLQRLARVPHEVAASCPFALLRKRGFTAQVRRPLGAEVAELELSRVLQARWASWAVRPRPLAPSRTHRKHRRPSGLRCRLTARDR